MNIQKVMAYFKKGFIEAGADNVTAEISVEVVRDTFVTLVKNEEILREQARDNVETIRKHARTIEMLKLELSDTHYETREGLSGN
tara:strand:- start:46 stop:300 length:255 start_codon:yes stop_codon:yes gene_type:complete